MIASVQYFNSFNFNCVVAQPFYFGAHFYKHSAQILHMRLGGGSLYDVGCYPVNFTGLVVDELARIQAVATGRPAGPAPMPESISVQCVKEGGVDVLFAALLNEERPRHDLAGDPARAPPCTARTTRGPR